MSEELQLLVDEADAAQTAQSEDERFAQLASEAASRVSQEEAVGANGPAMSDNDAKEALRGRVEQEYKQQAESLMPSPEEIKARGDMPATALARETWNAALGLGAKIVDVPGHVAGGLFDIADNLTNSFASFQDLAEGSGMQGTMFGQLARYGRAGFDAVDPLTTPDPEDKNHPVRLLTNAIGGFYLTRSVGVLKNVTTALSQYGRVGVAGGDALTTAVASAFTLAEDANLINALRSFGVSEKEWFQYVDSDEDRPEFLNRINNGLTDAGAGLLIEPFIALAKTVKNSRLMAKLVSARAEEAGEQVLEGTLNAAREHATNTRDQLIDILGDPTQPLYVKPGAAPKPTKGALPATLPTLEKVGLTVDEAADSLVMRSEATGTPHVPEPMTEKFNWSRYDSEDDIKQVMSDMQEGFDPEIGRAVGKTRRHADVVVEAGELDGWEVVRSGMRGEDLQDSEVLAMRDFYTFATRKLVEVAKVHRASPTDATRAAAAKMLDIVRMTQRVVRRESAQASRRLGQFRIPSKEGQGYELYREVQELVGDADGESALETVLKVINREADLGKTSAVANTILNATGFKLGKTAIEEGMKRLYYFSLLSRLTTQIRNAAGGPLHLAVKLTEMKAANISRRLLTGVDDGVYDGETLNAAKAFMQGMGEALRLPQIAKSWRDADAALSGDFKAMMTAGEGTFDGGVYKAFKENRSRFGGSMVSGTHSPKTALPALPTHQMGHSVGENMLRVTRLLSAGVDYSLTVPMRGLNAVDELWKTSFERMEVNTRAYRQTVQEMRAGKLAPEAMSARMDFLSANPNASVRMHGALAAQQGTFTIDPKVYTGSFGSWINQTNKLPYVGPLLMPFTKAPTNIAFEGIRRTPLGALMPDFLRDIRSLDVKTRDLAWSRFLVGNAMLLGTIDFFMDGGNVRIVGDQRPKSIAEGQQKKRMNLDTMSIQLDMSGNNFAGEFVSIPFRGFEPVAFQLGIAANLLNFMEASSVSEQEMEWTDLVTTMVSSIAATLNSQTTLVSMQEFFTAMHEKRVAEYVANQITSSISPGITEQFVPLNDEIYRETFSLLDKIKAATPGLSDSLPAARDAWGYEKRRLPGWQGVLQPIIPRSYDGRDLQPIDRWLADHGVSVGEPSKKSARFRPGVEIAWSNYPRAFERYKYLAGQGLLEPDRDPDILVQAELGNIERPPSGWVSAGVGLVHELNLLVEGKHPNMQGVFDMLPTDEDKERFVAQAVSFYRSAAREKLIMNREEFGDLRVDVMTRTLEAGMAEPNIHKRQKLEMGFGAEVGNFE